MKNRLVIGITGGSGSGKTHFLKKLLESFPEETMTLFSMDNYYKPIEKQTLDENGIENFDIPEALDRERIYRDLLRLKEGETLVIDEYNFNHFDKVPDKITIKPSPIIIVEGIFTFYYQEICKLLDLKVFIDTPDYLMLKRRITRDAQERGYDLDDVLYRFEYHVTPAYRKYIKPLKYEADLIVPNHTNFDSALKVISSYMREYTQK
jgi:uridine kinase